MACRVVVSAILLCFTLVSAVRANEPKPCCWINQMTGLGETLATIELEDGTLVLEETAYEFAYDAVFEAIALKFVEEFENGTTREERILAFYRYGVGFYIETNQGVTTCQRRRMPARFHRSCVPRDAEYKGNVTFGDKALTAHMWQYDTDEDGVVTNNTFFVAADYCVPVSLSLIHQDFNVNPPVPDIVTFTYGSIELGICDREQIFNVPDECPQDGVTAFGPEAMRRHQLMDMFFSM